MTYRLKDKYLQVLLDQISAEDFSAQLNEMASFKEHPNPFGRTRTVYFDLDYDTPVLLSVELTPDMVEKVEEYTPKAWNKFPEADPPEGVWMRCVMTDIHHNNRIVRVGAKFSAGAWRDHEGVAFEPRFRVDKFRPWDEDEESK